MVSFRGQKKLGLRPDRSPLGVSFKISDEQPHPFLMRSPPPRGYNSTGFDFKIRLRARKITGPFEKQASDLVTAI